MQPSTNFPDVPGIGAPDQSFRGVLPEDLKEQPILVQALQRLNILPAIISLPSSWRQEGKTISEMIYNLTLTPIPGTDSAPLNQAELGDQELGFYNKYSLRNYTAETTTVDMHVLEDWTYIVSQNSDGANPAIIILHNNQPVDFTQDAEANSLVILAIANTTKNNTNFADEFARIIEGKRGIGLRGVTVVRGSTRLLLPKTFPTE